VLLAVVWGVFRSEGDAVVEVPTAVRIVIEVVAFRVASAALVPVGRTGLAVARAAGAIIRESPRPADLVSHTLCTAEPDLGARYDLGRVPPRCRLPVAGVAETQ
jgi:hypothetical protein